MRAQRTGTAFDNSVHRNDRGVDHQGSAGAPAWKERSEFRQEREIHAGQQGKDEDEQADWGNNAAGAKRGSAKRIRVAGPGPRQPESSHATRLVNSSSLIHTPSQADCWRRIHR